MENQTCDDVDEDSEKGLREEVDGDCQGGEREVVLHVEGEPEGRGGEGHEAEENDYIDLWGQLLNWDKRWLALRGEG